MTQATATYNSSHRILQALAGSPSQSAVERARHAGDEKDACSRHTFQETPHSFRMLASRAVFAACQTAETQNNARCYVYACGLSPPPQVTGLMAWAHTFLTPRCHATTHAGAWARFMPRKCNDDPKAAVAVATTGSFPSDDDDDFVNDDDDSNRLPPGMESQAMTGVGYHTLCCALSGRGVHPAPLTGHW